MRYAAQRFGTWEWLDLEVPFTTEGPEWALSTYGVMEATVAPDLGLQQAADGRPVLEEWGTLIHAETGEGVTQRRWTGIVVRSELNGKEWSVTMHEFPGYFNEYPLEKKVWGVFADPAALFRQMVTDVQSMPNSNLFVKVNGSTTLRVGTDSDDLAAAAKVVADRDKAVVDAKNKIRQKASDVQVANNKANDKVNKPKQEEINKLQEVVNALVKNKGNPTTIAAKRAEIKAKQTVLTEQRNKQKPKVEELRKALEAARTAKEAADKVYEKSKDIYDKAKKKADDDGGAYKFLPEDFPDALESIGTLCKDTGIEWSTRTVFSTGAPNLHIDLHYPKPGTTRDDLLFEQGVNISSEIRLVRNGEEYANASLGLGAGEGAKAIRGSIASTSARMRRVTVYQDKKLKTSPTLLEAMRRDLHDKTGVAYVPEIEVVDHDLAPMFSWNVGDLIRVAGEVPHYGYYSELLQIVSWRMNGDHAAVIQLKLPR